MLATLQTKQLQGEKPVFSLSMRARLGNCQEEAGQLRIDLNQLLKLGTVGTVRDTGKYRASKMMRSSGFAESSTVLTVSGL